MSSVRERLKNQGLGRVADQIAAASKQSVCLTAGEIGEFQSSRLGGRPNLPAEFSWPEWKGTPLAFVAQIELSNLPPIPDVPLPQTGALFFFYEGGEQAWGFRPEDKGSSCVLYSPDSLNKHPARSFPKSSAEYPRFAGVQLIPGPIEESLPGGEDEFLAALELSAEERDAYWEFLEQQAELGPGRIHRIGGNPDCIQGDPKLEAQLVSHGLYCGDPSGYQTGKEKGLYQGASDWALLLQVDSEDKAEMMWGDVGRIYFLTRRTDLEQRRFDSTWLVFQCC